MRIIGLTGGIGSGKSTVAAYLKELGCSIVDADQIAREIVEPGSPVLWQLASAFGSQILLPDGSLDRRRLAAVAFASEEGKETLDRITHGEIQMRMQAVIDEFQGEILFLDVPLLFESGMDKMADQVWVVDTEDELRIKRVMDRDGLSEEEIRARMGRQMAREEKLSRADSVLSNSGSLQELFMQIDQLVGDKR